MRELTRVEMEMVQGGGMVTESAGVGGVVGSIAGAAIEGGLAGARVGGTYGALLGGTFGLSFEIGSYLYDQLS